MVKVQEPELPFFKQNKLIFLKYFDPTTESFTTIGDILVGKDVKMEELVKAIEQKHSVTIGKDSEGKFESTSNCLNSSKISNF